MAGKSSPAPILSVTPMGSLDTQDALRPAEVRTTAKDAYIYDHPIMQACLTMYAFSVDETNPVVRVN